MPRPPRIVLTAGDPCGIGPEVTLKALTAAARLRTRLLVIGDLPVFEATARRLRLRLPRWTTLSAAPSEASLEAPLMFLDCGHQDRFRPGRSAAAAGRASLAYLDRAMALWRSGWLDALVTAPVTKWAIAAVEPSFVGQTEYFARAAHCRDVVMMFAAERLRVVLLTRHLPLAAVSRTLTPRLLRTTIRLTARALRTDFGLARPRLALCGVNPHAGEAGRFGREERAVMGPALAGLAREGIHCDGPFAADGLFGQPIAHDAIVCAYHDQGLIPFKFAARDRGCQVSLGLPFVRTAPDHGSALDIAGKGRAHPGSMRYAIRLAAQLAAHRQHAGRKT